MSASKESLHEEMTITQAALVEYLSNQAVKEILIVECGKNLYRVKVLLTWKEGFNVLKTARGTQKIFKKLDTAANYLNLLGVGKTVIKLEIMQ